MALIICLLFCACGSGNNNLPNDALTANPEDNEFLPFDLEFGMSQEKAEEVYSNFPAVEYSDYESFYQIDGEALYEDMMEGNGIVLDPDCSFDFSDNQKLYGFTVKTKIYDSERSAERLFNEYLDFFQTKTGLDADVSETSGKLDAVIETETLNLSVILEEKDGDFAVSAITCCKVYK